MRAAPELPKSQDIVDRTTCGASRGRQFFVSRTGDGTPVLLRSAWTHSFERANSGVTQRPGAPIAAMVIVSRNATVN